MRSLNWKRVLIVGVVVLSLCGGAFWLFSGHSKSDIGAMARRGASETEMLDAVDAKKDQPKLSPDDIIALKKDGVPETVIIAMIRKTTHTETASK